MNSTVTEKSVLGACIAKVELLDDVIAKLPAAAFYHEAYRAVYETMRELRNERQPVDVVTLEARLALNGQLEALKVGQLTGEHLLRELANFDALELGNVDAYIRIILEAWTLRRFVGVCQEGIVEATEGKLEALDTVSRRIAEITLANAEERAEYIGDVCSAVLREMERPDYASGLSTRLPSLDKALGKLRPGDLTVVAGRPGTGKTSLSFQIGLDCAKGNEGGFGASCEMPNKQLVLRMASKEAGLNLRKIIDNAASWEERLKLAEAEKRLKPLPFIVDDTPGITLQQLRSALTRARRSLATKKVPLKIAVVDYIQLMKGTGDNGTRDQEIGELTRGLKGLAKEFNIHVIALSQLNRKVEERTDKRPIMSDLRESGNIEADADNIVFIYRDELYNRQTKQRGVAELIIGKQRNGPCGDIWYVHFDGETTSFRELTEQERLAAGLNKAS